MASSSLFATTGLDAVDQGVGKRILQAFRSSHPDKSSVLSKRKDDNSKDWIVRTDPDESPLEILKRLGARSGNKRVIPCIVYSRLPDLGSAPPEKYEAPKVQFYEEEGQSFIQAGLGYMELSYNITMLAGSRAEAQSLMLAWYFHIATQKGSFPIELNLDGQLLEGHKGEIVDPKTLLTEPMDLPNQGVFGYRQNIIVHAPVFYGAAIEPISGFRVDFNIEVID